MKLIVGLGNPGKKYERTRHNIGWRAVDFLVNNTPWKESKKFHAALAETNISENKVLLAKPLTYMNESGKAVKKIMTFYKVPINGILIIYDDIDLLVGTTRFRTEGSDGGHNGMSSIIKSIGKETIARIRIGIAEKIAGKQSIPAEDYVLQIPSKNAESDIARSISIIPDIIKDWIKK